MRYGGLLSIILAGALGGAESGDLRLAALLPHDDPRLVALAGAWEGRDAELLASFAAADRHQRRGAARLAALRDIAVGELLAAAGACQDPTVRRLAVQGLSDRLADLPPADLLVLQDPDLIAQLLLAHPDPEPWSDPQVDRALDAWLLDPAACAAVGSLIVARGDAARWGERLVGALGTDDPTVVANAHQALCLLTRQQRSLLAYAGATALLQQDWRDVLSASGVTVTVDHALLTAAGDLPDPESLAQLLGAGPAALPALEQAMAGAPRVRRQELQAVARLCARNVSPALYAAFGEAGLCDMDASDRQRRLACLKATAAAVLDGRDRQGLLHLLSYSADPDTVVRAAAFDRLVRLSDEHERFGGDWELAERELWPPAATLHHLRRALKEGSADEQVGALVFIGTLEASQLADDLTALLLAPDRAVVDTALDVLGRLTLGPTHHQALLRIAADARQPALRRVAVVGLVSKNDRWSSEGAAPAVVQALMELTGDPESSVANAARKAAFSKTGSATQRRALAEALLAQPGAARQAAFPLIAEHVDRGERGEVQAEDLVGLLTPILLGDDPAEAAAVAAALIDVVVDDERRRTGIATLLTAAVDGTGGENLLRLCRLSDQAQIPRLALALHLRLGDRDEHRRRLVELPAEGGGAGWRALIATAEEPLQAVIDLATALAHGQEELAEDWLARQVVERVGEQALLGEGRLEAIVAASAIDLLPSQRSSSSGGGRGMTRTISFADGQSLKLHGAWPEGVEGRSHGDDGQMHWTILAAPERRPDAAWDARALELLSGLQLRERPERYRRLVLALLAERDPPAELLEHVAEADELWRLLSILRPALRPRIVAQLNGAEQVEEWTLRRFLRPGDADLLPAVLRQLRSGDRSWIQEQLLDWLFGLPASVQETMLAELAGIAPVAADARFLDLLRQPGTVPQAVAMALLGDGRGLDLPVAADAAVSDEALRALLQDMPAERILAQAPALRHLRTASGAAFDAVVGEIAAGSDARALAWLRSGMPLQAGRRDLYEAALASPVDGLWLVGASLALKEGRLTAAAFLDRLRVCDAATIGTGSLVARRYLAEGLADQGPALAAILAACPLRSMNSWLLICPPLPELGPVLAARVADPSAATIIGYGLETRRREDPEAWRPVLEVVAAAAGGRLDHLIAE